MTIYIFAGPTLKAEEGQRELDAIFLPPVSQGDVYRVSLKQPRAIGIIDGRFRDVPSVWHKEILWALHQGIAVFGSASMGALRAAELSTFGMQGIGKIFEAYRDGIVEDDDEVVVTHGGPEVGFVQFSESMFNIRCTLEAAENIGILSAYSRTTLVALIKETFYAARTYPMLLQLGKMAELPENEMHALEEWLLGNHVDQKKADALDMLRAMRHYLEAKEPMQATFTFEHTQFFERARRSAGEMLVEASQEANATTGKITLENVLDELRLNKEAYFRVRNGALLRCLAVHEARRLSLDVSNSDLQSAADKFRQSRQLYNPEDIQLWLSGNHLNLAQFRALLKQELILERVKSFVETELDIYIRDQLRVDGYYSMLAAKAQSKRYLLESYGLDSPSLAIDNPTDEELLSWYFSERQQIPIPRNIHEYSRHLAFADVITFLQVIRREFWYSRIMEKQKLGTSVDLLS